MKKHLLLPCLLPAFVFLSLCPLFPQDAGTGAGGETELEGEGEEEEWADFGEAGEIIKFETPERPSQRQTVTREQIERIAAPDAAALLEEALDMPVTRHGAYGNSSDVNMRGFSTERIAILIDGVPANSAVSGGFDFYSLDVNNIERIEVIYGGSDSKYNVSGAVGGVINIITRKQHAEGLHWGFGVSNLSYWPNFAGPSYTEWDGAEKEPQWRELVDTQKIDASVSWGGERFSAGLHLFGSRAGNSYTYIDSFLYQVRRKQYNDVWDAGGGGILSWNFPNLSKLFLTFDAYYSGRTLPAAGFSHVAGKQRDVILRDKLMFEAPVFLRDDVSMEAALSYDFGRMYYSLNDTTPSVHHQNGIAFINRWGWHPSQKFTLRSGLDYRYIVLDSTGTGNRGRSDGGIYLTAEWSPVSVFHVIPSIKLVTDGAAVIPVPKLGLSWEAADFLVLKNNYFRSFKLPDFDDLYWAGGGYRGNPDLRPEDGWGADIVTEYRWRETFTAEGTVFAQYTFDSIHWHKSWDGNWEPVNIGEAALFGLDLRLKTGFDVSWWPVQKISPSASYQYLLTYLLCYGYSWEDEKRIPYQPMHTIGASVDVSWGSGSVALSGHYESLRYYSPANLIELAPHLLLNINVSQKIKEHFRVYAALRNLLNQSYESYNRYPMPGLNITAGLRFEY
jgi:vitamin B12 transporter